MLYIIGTNRERESIESNWKESSEIFIPIDRGYLFFDTHYLGNTQIHLRKSFIMSDNRDYMTLHLQTFSLSVRFFLKLNYTLIRKKNTFQASLSKNPERGSVRFQFSVRQTRCARNVLPNSIHAPRSS